MDHMLCHCIAAFAAAILCGVSCSDMISDGSSSRPVEPCTGSYILLESPSAFSMGYGEFGDPASQLFSCDGSLADPENDFDTGINGDFARGKFIRIVENGMNITDSAGLNLEPVGVTDTPAQSPRARVYPGGEIDGVCYINPAAGWFVLPRPSWWNRLESWDTLSSPVLNDSAPYVPTYTTPLNSSVSAAGLTYLSTAANSITGQFGSGISVRTVANSGSATLNSYTTYQWSSGIQRDISQYGGQTAEMSAGTLSCWVRLRSAGSSSSSSQYSSTTSSSITLSLLSSDNATLRLYFTQADTNEAAVTLAVSGTTSGTTLANSGSWRHIFIVWDSDKSLFSGRSVRVFLNGAEILYSAADLPDLHAFPVSYSMRASAQYRVIMNNATGNVQASANPDCSSVSIDNLQLWNHVVSEDPAWIYNGGTGREDALHVIYSPGNGYRPRLDTADDGVGYYVPLPE